jgi:hypothetical protein
VPTLDPFFGIHTGELEIYSGNNRVGDGAFRSFSSFEAEFARRVKFFVPLDFLIKLTDHDPDATSGPCEVTANNQVDGNATYNTGGGTIKFTTHLAAPYDVFSIHRKLLQTKLTLGLGGLRSTQQGMPSRLWR